MCRSEHRENQLWFRSTGVSGQYRYARARVQQEVPAGAAGSSCRCNRKFLPSVWYLSVVSLPVWFSPLPADCQPASAACGGAEPAAVRAVLGEQCCGGSQSSPHSFPEGGKGSFQTHSAMMIDVSRCSDVKVMLCSYSIGAVKGHIRTVSAFQGQPGTLGSLLGACRTGTTFLGAPASLSASCLPSNPSRNLSSAQKSKSVFLVFVKSEKFQTC